MWIWALPLLSVTCSSYLECLLPNDKYFYYPSPSDLEPCNINASRNVPTQNPNILGLYQPNASWTTDDSSNCVTVSTGARDSVKRQMWYTTTNYLKLDNISCPAGCSIDITEFIIEKNKATNPDYSYGGDNIRSIRDLIVMCSSSRIQEDAILCSPSAPPFPPSAPPSPPSAPPSPPSAPPPSSNDDIYYIIGIVLVLGALVGWRCWSAQK